jgi:hypothetical protein
MAEPSEFSAEYFPAAARARFVHLRLSQFSYWIFHKGFLEIDFRSKIKPLPMECHLLFTLVGMFAMWKMIFFLWLVPGALALIALSRAANGAQPIRAAEWRLLFGKSKQTTLSPWLWLGFAALAIGFFVLGVIQAVVLLNLSGFWAAVAPLFTGAAAAVLLILLLRVASSRPRNQPRRYRCAAAHSRRISDLFSR